MTQIVMGAAVGLVMGVTLGAACGIRAETEPTDALRAIAEEVGLDPYDLLGALNTTGLEPREYLYQTGVLERPRPPTLREYAYQQYPAQARCIEQIVLVESAGWVTHGYNPQPWGQYAEHASGLGGFLPSTWRTTPEAGSSIWDGYAQVRAIAWMLRVGRGREFAAVSWGRCG